MRRCQTLARGRYLCGYVLGFADAVVAGIVLVNHLGVLEQRIGDVGAGICVACNGALGTSLALYGALGNQTQPLSAFLARYPEHALAVERVEIGQRYPYAEIHDNLIAASCLPIDMLRCKLSFFGASKFDPKSDRWTRITLCQGAPLVGDLDGNVDDWWLPVFAP